MDGWMDRCWEGGGRKEGAAPGFFFPSFARLRCVVLCCAMDRWRRAAAAAAAAAAAEQDPTDRPTDRPSMR